MELAICALCHTIGHIQLHHSSKKKTDNAFLFISTVWW
uniref:Uncharacterized protein n=1 Tax=Anguilla anguilla TaxID=7936 RepID=A0A0E9RZJ4_ANGAN